jgi:hypothetical protein
MPNNATTLSRRETLARLSAAAAVVISPAAASPLTELTTSPTGTEQLCTIEQLAAIDFQPIAEFIDYAAALPKIREKLNRLYTAAGVGIGFLGKTKAQLVEIVRELDGVDDPCAVGFHECLTEAREYAEGLVQFLTAAETRFAVAMAVTAIEQGAPPAASAAGHHGTAEA